MITRTDSKDDKIVDVTNTILWCYKSGTLGVRQAIMASHKCHARRQAGSGGVTKVSHIVPGRQR